MLETLGRKQRMHKDYVKLAYIGAGFLQTIG